jgi:hypothetical protein
VSKKAEGPAKTVKAAPKAAAKAAAPKGATLTPKAPVKEIDWELIERDYRAGVLSVREVAASQGITHGAINKRAKRDGWERDLKAKIQAKAEALVSKREVSSAVSAERVATDRVIVEANAERIADVRMAHRTDIARGRRLAISLWKSWSTRQAASTCITSWANCCARRTTRARTSATTCITASSAAQGASTA